MFFSVAIVPGSIYAVISGPIQSAPLRTDLATPEYCSDGAVRSLSFLRRDHRCYEPFSPNGYDRFPE